MQDEGNFLQQNWVFPDHRLFHVLALLISSIDQQNGHIQVILTDKGLIKSLEVFFWVLSLSNDDNGQLFVFVEKTLVSSIKIILLKLVGLKSSVGSKFLT